MAYYSLVKAGAGVGLLGNYALADPHLSAVQLEVHIPIPVYVITLSNRLQFRPIKAVYDWLCSIFEGNRLFAEELHLPRDEENQLGVLLDTIAPAAPLR